MLPGRAEALFLRSCPLHSLNRRQNGQEGKGNRKLWWVSRIVPVTLLLLLLLGVWTDPLNLDLYVVQESVATRRTHCAVVAVAALTTSRRAHALAAATLLPGRGPVSILEPLGWVGRGCISKGALQLSSSATAAAAVLRGGCAACKTQQLATDPQCQ